MLLTLLALGIEADLATMQATLADLKAAAETLQSEAQLLQTASTFIDIITNEDLSYTCIQRIRTVCYRLMTGLR